ncbi:MAG: DNA replication/repair protein RecF [Rhodobiaceae bacterium]|nr:MAG: DNA replication/repair protein RecF [Rhodobiaceae bacterium]
MADPVAIEEPAPASAVHLSRLVVTHFRSYERAALVLDGRPVVLTGPNGAGKTNLLEAISLLSPGRGLRGVPFSDLGYRAQGEQTSRLGWGVAATLMRHQGEVWDESVIGTGQNAPTDPELDEPPRVRTVRIDGETQSSAGVLTDYVRVLWLTPAQDRLFLDGAGGRRRFLDRLVMGFDPTHGTRVNAFEKVLRERNRLLSEDVRDVMWYAAVEEQIAEYGVAMAAARVETIARLKGAIDAAAESAFPKSLLALSGDLEAALGEGEAATDVEDRYRARLEENRARDRGAGRTLDGPHRSDLLVRHAPKDMEAKACSTGEQKALLLGLILANTRLLTLSIGAPPLLLLDEVAAHLDAERRAALFDELCDMGVQAWMTGTDASLFQALGSRAQAFDVRDNRCDISTL